MIRFPFLAIDSFVMGDAGTITGTIVGLPVYGGEGRLGLPHLIMASIQTARGMMSVFAEVGVISMLLTEHYGEGDAVVFSGWHLAPHSAQPGGTAPAFYADAVC